MYNPRIMLEKHVYKVRKPLSGIWGYPGGVDIGVLTCIAPDVNVKNYLILEYSEAWLTVMNHVKPSFYYSKRVDKVRKPLSVIQRVYWRG